MASSPSSPHPLSNPNPKSTATFTSTPLPQPNHQEHLVERAKRRRQRALRMSREKQIPALALHCASQFPSNPCCKENPHSFLKDEGIYLNEDSQFRQYAASQEALPPPYNGSPGGGLVIYDGRLLNNKAFEEMHAFSDCSGGDGDVSDVGNDRGPDLFELRNWRNGYSSSPSSSYEGPLNVTRAASECSADEHTEAEFGILNNRPSMKIHDDGSDKEGYAMKDDLSAEYWRLQADVLAAECNLLRVEKELALRRWNQGYVQNDAINPMVQVLKEQGGQMHSFPSLRFDDAWAQANMLGVRARTIDKRATRESMLNNRCYAETCTSRKQGYMSLELLETNAAAAFIRREYRSMLSEEGGLPSGRTTDQMLGEEMYCKAAIRQIVAQVQAESEQWSQVQEILLSLQEEMGILIEARELWHERAIQAEAELLSLKEMVDDWRCRAQSADEEVAILRSERQAFRIKIHNMKQKHAAERRRWNEAGRRPSEGVPLPRPDSQPSIGVACEVEDQPRHANVGTQEDYALCESIVHSRNESSRSSVDLGTISQRGFQKSIKKALDFSNSSIDGNTSKSRLRSHRLGDQILKIEPTRLDFCSKTSDVNNKARHKLSGPLPKVELTRLECVEPVSANEHKERKKARLFTSKENYSKSGPMDAQVSFFAEPYVQKGSLGEALRAGQDSAEHVILSKTKSSLPSAPTSTPSRLPFAEIFNSPTSR